MVGIARNKRIGRGACRDRRPRASNCVLGALWRRGAAIGLLSAAALLGSPVAAAAAVFTVTGTADNTNACSGSSCPSLRSAVLASNHAGGSNTIKVPAGQYKLTRTPAGSDDGLTGDLHITADVTILGAGDGAGGTIVVGDGDRLFDISAAKVALSGMAMTGGSAEDFGGAIHDTGASLALIRDALRKNRTNSDGGFGGAVSIESNNAGTLIVRNSIFALNTAADSGPSGGGFGGAIDFEPSTTGHLTVINSEFDSNTAQSGTTSGGGFGGGISFEPSDAGTLTITGSTFSGNVAAGSSSQGGFGGGISFEPGSAPSPLTITNSTFTGNKAGGLSSFGGAIDWEPNAGSTGTLRQVTIAGNSTSTKNQGGGLWIQDAPLTIENSIVSGNTGGGAVDNCTRSGGTVVAKGHNVEVGKTCGFDIHANPLLLALANNGGPTRTMALAAGSSARDTADPGFCPKIDQRGVARPDDPGTPCDIGAYESLAPPHGTKITSAAIKKTKFGRTAAFKFTAAGQVTGFQCALARQGKTATFTKCKSPKSYQHLSSGTYVFKVRAFNSAGVDPHPATKQFTI